MVIGQVSISRWHATVSFTEDGRFVLEDHNSKFGTLVALRRPRVIEAAPPREFSSEFAARRWYGSVSLPMFLNIHPRVDPALIGPCFDQQ